MATAGTSRRRALQFAGASALCVLSGCSTGDPPPVQPSPPRTTAGVGDEAGDEALLQEVRRDLVALLALATASADVRVGRRRPLAAAVAPVIQRLSDRLDALGKAPPQPPTAEPLADPARALRRLRAVTLARATDVRAAASGARSGDLARLFASVAAGLAQDGSELGRLPQPGGPSSAPAGPASPGLTDVTVRADDAATVDAAAQVLAGEHAALYAYGVVGGRRRSSPTEASRAERAYLVHRSRRDTLTEALRAAGATPVAAEPAYELPVAVTSAASAQRVGQQVEDRCSVLYALLVATTPPGRDGIRAEAAAALVDSALRLLGWGGAATALPGVQRP